MNIEPTKIDDRNFKALLKEFKSLTRIYAKELLSAQSYLKRKGPVFTMAVIFCRMLEKSIQRLNRVPEKHFLSFLDKLGFHLLPPQPAAAPLTFTLTEGTEEHVFVPARTAAAAGDTIFETKKNFLITPAKITALYSFNNLLDQVYDHSGDFENDSPFEIFSGEDKQEHLLYLGHKDLLNIKETGKFILKIDPFDNKWHDEEIICWEYWGEDEKKEIAWHTLDIAAGSTGGEIHLVKEKVGEIKEYEINGIAGRWLRCRVKPGKISLVKKQDEDMEIKFIHVDFQLRGKLMPDMLYHNDVHINLKDTNEQEELNIYPFGKEPGLYDCFYIASREVFTKRGLAVEIKFQLAACEAESGRLLLSWEYWDGKSWKNIEHLVDNTRNFTAGSDTSGTGGTMDWKTVQFPCPGDIEIIDAAGEENYWIRVRIIAGDYGRAYYIYDKSDKKLVYKDETHPPQIRRIEMIYSLNGDLENFHHIITLNNLHYMNLSPKAKNEKTGFNPFIKAGDSHKCIYVGFDKKVEQGPISLFFHIEEPDFEIDKISELDWQYYAGKGKWVTLEAVDQTRGLLRNGFLEFSVPLDFEKTRRFGEKRYWIRAEEMKERVTNPKIKNIFLNTTPVIQVETIEDELLGSGDSSANQIFTYSRLPVIAGEIWIDEIKTISENERKLLIDKKAYEVKEIRDDRGELEAFPVKWKPVDDLIDSLPRDRHYTLDPWNGRITCGDGIKGKPIPLGTNNIRANYRVGGGARGNLPAFAIKDLKTAISFIDEVYNPLPAEGGTDVESKEHLITRAPKVLKHRGRAVTPEDFEQLALQASREVARVKCLPNFDNNGRTASGWVRVIVIPHSSEKRPALSLQFKRNVENYIRERAANILVEPNRLLVTGPMYVEVSVNTELVASTIDVITLIKEEAYSRIGQFLHPLSGGEGGKGWTFGRLPCLSDFYSILGKVDGLEYVKSLELNLKTYSGDKVLSTGSLGPGEATIEMPDHAVVFSGEHSITVEIKKKRGGE